VKLRCPYCGEPFEVLLEYSGGSHSEHRDLTGFNCENYACDALWDRFGELTRPSKLSPLF
jgi:hypothetical protein